MGGSMRLTEARYLLCSQDIHSGRLGVKSIVVYWQRPNPSKPVKMVSVPLVLTLFTKVNLTAVPS